MSESTHFSRGDVVIHPRRPEWGEGVIDQAVVVTHEGKPAQRLVVRFVNEGLITINTGVAPLVRKEALNTMATTTKSDSSSFTAPTGHGWLGSLDSNQKSISADLARLSDAMTDPFANISRRLQATLDSYRYSTEPRSLIEWGIAQTGLTDPLSKYTRHDLEQAFPRFARDRDNNLQEIVRLIKKQGKSEMIEEALRTTISPAAKNALQRARRN